MRFWFCMNNLLMQKNITFIMQSVAFILCHHKFIQRSIFSYTKWSNTFRSNFYCLIAPMTTYLKDLTQSLGRHGGFLKIRFGFKGFWCTSSISTWCGIFWLAKMGGKHHMLKDLRQYDFYVNVNKHKPLPCLPCPTSTILAYNILMGAHNHKRFPG